jgi:hypothetical protein
MAADWNLSIHQPHQIFSACAGPSVRQRRGKFVNIKPQNDIVSLF